jgi:5-methylcytosine-specific restriction endonuclease McrA
VGLTRKTPLESKTGLKRSRIKSREPRRDWTEAITKVQEEGRCRVCGASENLEAAHVIPRAKSDERVTGPRGGEVLRVPRDAVVPLCREHHGDYDAHRLDLLPFLFVPEQIFAVKAAGGILSALKRISASARTIAKEDAC